MGQMCFMRSAILKLYREEILKPVPKWIKYHVSMRSRMKKRLDGTGRLQE